MHKTESPAKRYTGMTHQSNLSNFDQRSESGGSPMSSDIKDDKILVEEFDPIVD